MRKLFFIAIVTICAGSIFLVAGVFALKHVHGHKKSTKSKAVYIQKTLNGLEIIRNGKPFYIRGAAGYSHFKELAEAGGNTIRVYDTINIQHILDVAHANNLAVIVDIPIPRYNKKYNPYQNKDDNRLLKHKIKKFVQKYKDHPSLLMWNLGNELHYPFTFKKNTFINTFNELIDIIHREDPNHLVSTAVVTVSRKQIASIWFHSPKLNVIGFNIFGSMQIIHPHLKHLSFLFGKKPYYISEFGPDGPWESRYTAWGAPIEHTSAKKTEQTETRYKIITGNDNGAILGSLIFIWGRKFETTHTWFSLFKGEYKAETIKTLENLWKNSSAKPALIGLDYMLLDNKGAADNIVFAPNEIKNAELIFTNTETDSLKIVWEIYSGLLDIDEGKINSMSDKSINSFVDFENYKATFITPAVEGPYRIFAYVYDKDGYFATTNTPFYVLKKK